MNLVIEYCANSNANDCFSTYLDKNAAIVSSVVEVRGAVNDSAIAARNLILVSSEADERTELELVKAADAHMQDALSRLQSLVESYPGAADEDRKAVQAITEVESLYGPVATLVTAIVLGFLFISSLFRSLGAEPAELDRIVKRVAAGDLSKVEGAENAKPGSVLASSSVMVCPKLVRL